MIRSTPSRSSSSISEIQGPLEAPDDHQEASRIDQQIGVELGVRLRRMLRIDAGQHLGDHARER